jgi:hypothetical protein
VPLIVQSKLLVAADAMIPGMRRYVSAVSTARRKGGMQGSMNMQVTQAGLLGFA